MDKKMNFLHDQSYCDLIELCICRNDKFGAGTFFADVTISEYVKDSCINNEIRGSVMEIIPPDIDDRYIDDMNFFDCDDDGDDEE